MRAIDFTTGLSACRTLDKGTWGLVCFCRLNTLHIANALCTTEELTDRYISDTRNTQKKTVRAVRLRRSDRCEGVRRGESGSTCHGVTRLSALRRHTDVT